MTMRTAGLLVGFVFASQLAGCRDRKSPTEEKTAAPATAASVADGKPTGKAAPSATSADASAAGASGAPASGPLENLILTTQATVTVSSRVDNPRDYPEHLVDGKPGTAWNGKTGDLNAWIEVEIDPRAQVSAIAITAGFDKGALFTKNLRISSVRIERNGTTFRDAVKLDPNERGLQRIPIDQAGGTYRIVVTSTVQGTEASYREVVVSDLQVLGRAPEAIRLPKPMLPILHVAPGSAPPPQRVENIGEVAFEGRRGKTATSICDAWKKEVLALVRAQHLDETVSCKAITTPPVEGGPAAEYKSLTAVQRDYFDGVAIMQDRDLVFELPDGTWLAGPRYSSTNDIGDSPTPRASGVRIVSGSPTRLVTATTSSSPASRNSLPDGGVEPPNGGTVESEGKLCTLAPGNFTCDKDFVRYERRDVSQREFEALNAQKKVTFPVLDSAGHIRPLADD